MTKSWKILGVAGLGVLAVSGCTRESHRLFNSEAGAQLYDGTFGNATMNNTYVQSHHGGHAPPLNGKYGAVIFGETIRSAVPAPATAVEVEAGG